MRRPASGIGSWSPLAARAEHGGATVDGVCADESSTAAPARLACSAVCVESHDEGSFCAAGVAVVAKARAAGGDRVGQDIDHRRVERRGTIRRYASSAAGRVELRAPEGFVRVDVADASEVSLIHDDLLHGLSRSREQPGELLGGKRGVKRLGAERRGVRMKPLGRHEGNGAESADVAVVECAAVVEVEVERGVLPLAGGEIAGVDEERPGEAGLHDEPVAGRKIDHGELSAPPAAEDRGARGTSAKLGGRDFAQDIGPRDADVRDGGPSHRGVEPAGDGFDLR